MLENKFVFRNRKFALLHTEQGYTIMVDCGGIYTQMVDYAYKTAAEAVEAAKARYKFMCMGFMPMPTIA